MSSVMPFSYNTVELCVVTINEKPWARGREVCKVLEYNKNTTNIVKNHCSKENYTQKYRMSSVLTAVTPVDWPKDSQKFDIYVNEEAMYEIVFSSQQPKARERLQETLLQCVVSSCLTAAYKQNEGRISTSHQRKR